MTEDNKIKDLVLEQARTLAKDFVTEFRAEVTRQLGTSEANNTVPESEPPSPDSSPEGIFLKSCFEGYKKDSWGRNTTGGLSALKLVPVKNVDKPHQEALTPLTDTHPRLNDNFTEERVQKLIDSVDSRIKNIAQTMEDGLEKEELIQTLERTRDSLNNTLQHPLGRDAEDVLRLQASQEKIRARNAMIKTVYSSDLGEEIQAQAKALLPLVEALEQKQQPKHTVLTDILSKTLPIDQKEKEAGIFSDEDLTPDVRSILGQEAGMKISRSRISDEEREKHSHLRDVVQNMKHDIPNVEDLVVDNEISALRHGHSS